MLDFIHKSDLIFYLIIPFFSALVGWGTNVLAIKMTFYPLEFFGIPPIFGWQGIIPSKAVKMAGKSVDLMMDKLINVRETFSRIDPHKVAEMTTHELEIVSKKITDKIMMSQAPFVWRTTPDYLKKQVYKSVADELPAEVEELMEDIKENIEELFDIKQMVIKALSEDKALLNEIFLRCGEKEFKFIERSGIYFGFLFGLIQMTIWFFFQPWWFLPLAGLIVGYATNWIALKLIFRPVHPVKVGPWTVQGLFMKRQREVSIEYAHIVSEKVLNPQNIFENMLYDSTNHKLSDILTGHVEKMVEHTAGTSIQLLDLIKGKNNMETIKSVASFHFIDHFPMIIHQIMGYAEHALDMENTFREKMTNLSPEEFQGFLRPVFQEDEMKLILVGAALGAIAGFLQFYFFF